MSNLRNSPVALSNLKVKGHQDNNRGHCVGAVKWVNKAAIILHLFTYKGVSNMSAVLNKELLMY